MHFNQMLAEVSKWNNSHTDSTEYDASSYLFGKGKESAPAWFKHVDTGIPKTSDEQKVEKTKEEIALLASKETKSKVSVPFVRTSRNSTGRRQSSTLKGADVDEGVADLQSPSSSETPTSKRPRVSLGGK